MRALHCRVISRYLGAIGLAKERLKTLIGLSRHSGTHAAARSRKLSWLRSPDLNLRSVPISPARGKLRLPRSGTQRAPSISYLSRDHDPRAAKRHLFWGQSYRPNAQRRSRAFCTSPSWHRQTCDKLSDFLPPRASVVLPRQQVVPSTVR
jgi:hypothetical protein